MHRALRSVGLPAVAALLLLAGAARLWAAGGGTMVGGALIGAGLILMGLAAAQWLLGKGDDGNGH